MRILTGTCPLSSPRDLLSVNTVLTVVTTKLTGKPAGRGRSLRMLILRGSRRGLKPFHRRERRGASASETRGRGFRRPSLPGRGNGPDVAARFGHLPNGRGRVTKNQIEPFAVHPQHVARVVFVLDESQLSE